SFDRKKGRSPLHLVSAYATEGGLVLAQRAAEEKRGELTVLPDLLDGLDLHGCLVSLDALACRPDIAGHIIGQGGDYLLTLKGNRKKAHAEVEAWFATNAFARRAAPSRLRRVRREPRPAGAPAGVRLPGRERLRNARGLAGPAGGAGGRAHSRHPR